MKKTNYLEIIGVLSLSFILTSAMSVSGCIPAMIEEFSSYSRSSVELLLSVPAFAMMTMIALSPVIAKYVPERSIVAMGLLIFAAAGLIPVFVRSYPFIFVSRIVFGLGTGLVNAKAITMVGERFTGELQQKLQGIRCSMETLGQTAMTLIAGQLLVFGWNYSFLIYAVAFVILILFLLFVPERKNDASEHAASKKKSEDSVESNAALENDKKGKLTKKELPFILGNALLGYLMVSTNVSLSLRIPSYMLETGMGTAVDGATVMGISTFAGFLAGIVFGSMAKKLKDKLLPVSLSVGAAGLFIILFANRFVFVAFGAALTGFCVTCCTSKVFGSLPERLPTNTLATANAAVLVGCNLGSFTAPFVLGAINMVSPDLKAGFVTYGAVYIMLIICMAVKLMVLKRNK